MIKLVAIPEASIKAIWPRLDGVYADACTHSHGALTKDVIKARALAGLCTIWIAADNTDTAVTASCVTSVMEFQGGLKAMFVELLGGKVKYDIFDFRTTLEKKAAELGCTRLYFLVPRRWASKLSDYDLTNVLMCKELTP